MTSEGYFYQSGFNSSFKERRVAERSLIIELKSIYGLSVLRDVTATAGSGSVSNTLGSGEYTLATTANGADSATLDSAERGRYIPGIEAETGIGVRLSAATVTGSQDVRWGYFDDDNGLFFGLDSEGLYVAVRRDGVTTKIRRRNWNGDRVDGTRTLALDLTRGNIFNIDFSWYGYGSIEWAVYLPDGINQQERIVMHRFSPDGETSIKNPNLPIRAQVENGGTAEAFSLFVAGRQFSLVGKASPAVRITSDYRLQLGSVNTTFLPTISMRRKTAYLGTSVKLQGVSVLGDADLLVQMRTGGSLTGASYATPADHTATETAIEADKSATAITGGQVLWETLIDSTGTGTNVSGGAAVTLPNLDFIGTDPVTLCVRRVSGTGSTVDAVLRVIEEW